MKCQIEPIQGIKISLPTYQEPGLYYKETRRCFTARSAAKFYAQIVTDNWWQEGACRTRKLGYNSTEAKRARRVLRVFEKYLP